MLLARAAEAGAPVTVPASALAQAIRRPERQARLARLIREPKTDVVPLDRLDATNIGRLLATSGTADITDAHVVVCARRHGQQVITTDPDDLRRLDPHLDLVTRATSCSLSVELSLPDVVIVDRRDAASLPAHIPIRRRAREPPNGTFWLFRVLVEPSKGTFWRFRQSPRDQDNERRRSRRPGTTFCHPCLTVSDLDVTLTW
ncbi:MAG: PIN domain-containing protein [Actinobacteria bacterium]|nr:PIN domain-containing protein [Actinomycetota bacterium]